MVASLDSCHDLSKQNDALLINNAVTAGHNASVKHVSKSRMNDLSGFLAELLFPPSLSLLY